MVLEFEQYGVDLIREKYAWRICDFAIVNSDRLKRYFPKTLEQNLTPDLSRFFVEKKVKQLNAKEEFLFVLKENQHRTVIGLVYIKKIDWRKKQGELAYCIGYQYKGKGWMTQSIKALSKYAFEVLDLRILQIIAHRTNKPSVRVAEKCGYIWQKTLANEHTPPNEEPLDMELYELYL